MNWKRSHKNSIRCVSFLLKNCWLNDAPRPMPNVNTRKCNIQLPFFCIWRIERIDSSSSRNWVIRRAEATDFDILARNVPLYHSSGEINEDELRLPFGCLIWTMCVCECVCTHIYILRSVWRLILRCTVQSYNAICARVGGSSLVGQLV